jgi:hypothetical protein
VDYSPLPFANPPDCVRGPPIQCQPVTIGWPRLGRTRADGFRRGSWRAWILEPTAVALVRRCLKRISRLKLIL